MSTSATWTLIPDAPVDPDVSSGQILTEQKLTADSLTFLGKGLVRPFRRDEKNDFANDGGLNLVASAVGQILGTKAASENNAGELPWRPEFGSLLHLLRHRNIDSGLQELARASTIDAINAWEPRARITAFSSSGTNTKSGGREDALTIKLKIGAARRNDPQNRIIVDEVTRTFTFKS